MTLISNTIRHLDTYGYFISDKRFMTPCGLCYNPLENLSSDLEMRVVNVFSRLIHKHFVEVMYIQVSDPEYIKEVSDFNLGLTSKRKYRLVPNKIDIYIAPLIYRNSEAWVECDNIQRYTVEEYFKEHVRTGKMLFPAILRKHNLIKHAIEHEWF